MKTNKADEKAYDDMQMLSAELGKNKDISYTHDPYQATISACVIALD